MDLGIFCRLWKNIQLSNLMKIQPVESSCFMWTGRQAGMKKLILSFRNLAKVIKKKAQKKKKLEEI